VLILADLQIDELRLRCYNNEAKGFSMEWECG
jgi:hypothetical protein